MSLLSLFGQSRPVRPVSFCDDEGPPPQRLAAARPCVAGGGRGDEIPRRHRRPARDRRHSRAALPCRRPRHFRRLCRRRYLLRHIRIFDLRHDRRGHPQRIVLAREFLQAPDPAHPAGAIRSVPGHQRSCRILLPAGRTGGLRATASPAPWRRSRMSTLRRPPAISTLRPKPSRCCTPGRSASKSSSISQLRC